MSSLQRAKLDFLEGAVIVGVDIAKKQHWARITDRAGYDLVKPFDFKNTTYEKAQAQSAPTSVEFVSF